MTRLALPLKYHGGKFYLAPRINALMPPHLHYVEPYCGGCAVLMAHPGGGEGRSELINDLNRSLTNFWRVLRDPSLFGQFSRYIEAMPLSRIEWDEAIEGHYSTDAKRAVAFFVRCRQSLAGRMKSFTPPTRTRLRRGMNGNVSEWLGAVEGLPAVHERIRRVFVENMDAVALMRREDTSGTLFYCDPPYVPATRSSPDVYAHEMTVEQHREFLDVALACEGKVMISGYATALYDDALAGWTRHAYELPNNAAGGAGKRRMTEVLWCNY